MADAAHMAADSDTNPAGAGGDNARALIDENTENFPVGSFLIPPEFRPHVHAFYIFARRGDDIADSDTIEAAEKIAQLETVQRAIGVDEAALPEWAVPYHRSLAELGLTPANGANLLSAFIQDATKTRYADWDELMDYCARSAASVGRVMMDIHGETATADIEGSDALCNALQMLNHVQDCKKDYLALDRVYLPEPWLKEAGGGVEDLANSHASPAVRAVIDRCLDQVDTLLARARAMPATVKRRRFRVECALIVQLALALSKKLRRQDPMAQRVKVSKLGWLWCGARAIIRAW